MRKLLILLAIPFMAMQVAFAQKAVEGVVLSSDGDPVVGAAVVGQGTTIGDFTDERGEFSLNVPENVNILVVSFIGMQTQEVVITGERLSISMAPSDVTLDEVVVTALGIKRDERSLGYSVQEISGENTSYVRDQNVVSALSGKIAGVQVSSASGASLGGSANIRIRGANSLTGGQPLFVVDGTPISNGNFSASYRGLDFGNLAQDINPDDIESISVLKGPSATALYGNRAANGVVLITTKSGNSRRGIGVDVNSSVTFENVYILPNYQNEYGGGYTQDFIKYTDPVDGKEYNTLNYAADESWGPKMDGTMYRPWWSWYPGTADYGTEIPMQAQPDNVRNFFETGLTYNNSVSLSGGNENTSFRLSYNNVTQTGVIPNSSLKRNNLGINAKTKLTEKLTLSTSLNIANNAGHGRPTFGYTTGNVVWSMNQWFQRQLDMDRLRDYRNPDGSLRSWNIRSPENLRPLYWNSPFFDVEQDLTTDSRDRYFGNFALKYEITDNLSISGIVRRDSYSQRYEDRIGSGGLDQDRYQEFVANAIEDNFEFLAQYDNNFGPFSLNINAGANIRKNDYHSNFMGTVGGLNAPNLFNIKASIDRPSVTSFVSEKIVRSVYGAASLGFNDMVYLDATLRNDWSSALPTDNNSYLYPSVSASFIFSELWGQSDLFSYGKIRASFAQVGSDIGAYQTNFTYNAGNPYGSTPTFSLPNTLINEGLLPALSSSYEAGIDLRFFNNRVGLDVTYYKNNATDQILTLQVPGSSGFSSAIINAGNISSEGVEIAVNITPVRNKDFQWDININAARNRSQTVELADGLDNFQLGRWGWGGLSINAPVGEEWGQFRGRGYKLFQATDAEGNEVDHPSNGMRIVDENGYVKEDNKELGGFLPDWTGGFRNTFVFKGFELTGFVEFQVGGQFHSVTKMFNAYSGLSTETVGLNDKGNPVRDPLDQGGGVRVSGVDADGNAAEYYVESQNFWSGNMFANNEAWLYDQSYVKLRELRAGYTFPKSWYQKLPIQNVNLSVIARNVWLIFSNVDGIDPSEISPGSNAYVFQENGILPGVRSIGANLRLSF